MAAQAAWEVARAEGWRHFDGEDLEQVAKAARRERRRIARELSDALAVSGVDAQVAREACEKAMAIQRDETVELDGFGVWLVLGAPFWNDEVGASGRKRGDQLSLFGGIAA